jgi:hypothetical protein
VTTVETISFHSVRGRHRRRTTRLDWLAGPAAWLLEAVEVVRSAALFAFVAGSGSAVILLAINWRS